MSNQSLGTMIRALRTERSMTQLDLARQMGVTDKAVSKWERDLSIPDVSSLPRLAGLLGVSVEELLQAKGVAREGDGDDDRKAQARTLALLVLRAVALATGVGVTVLTFLDEVEPRDALGLLGIGLACLAASQITEHGE